MYLARELCTQRYWAADKVVCPTLCLQFTDGVLTLRPCSGGHMAAFISRRVWNDIRAHIPAEGQL